MWTRWMGRGVLLWGLLLWGALPAQAQFLDGYTPRTATAELTTTDAGGACASTACVALNLGGYTAVAIQVTGTCGTCTLEFEVSVDNTNWVALNLIPPNSTTGVGTTTTTGIWSGNVGSRYVRARLSARASGSFVVTIYATAGIARSRESSPAYDSVLNSATGDEVAFNLAYTVNKATSGNDTGVLISMTDTSSPGTSKPLAVTVGGTEIFSVNWASSVGNLLFTGDIGTVGLTTGTPGTIYSRNAISMSATATLRWETRTRLKSPTDGLVLLTNKDENGFTGVILGTNGTSGIRIKKNGTAFNLRLGDDSADAALTAGAITGSSFTVGSSAGVTVTTCTQFTLGICTAGS